MPSIYTKVKQNSLKIVDDQIKRPPMNLPDNVLVSLYLFLGGLFCLVIHPVCRLEVINESFAKTGSHIFYLKNNKIKIK